MKIIINTPKIEIKANYAYLISKIELPNNEEYKAWFKVEKKYAEYLCNENCNSFLVSLIPFYIKHNYDVEVKGKVSAKLYYQLVNYLLPILCDNFKKRHIKINCDLTNQIFHSKGVGASISCGVDSFYTLLKHRNQKDSSYNITHLTFFNAGSHGNYGGDNARELFHQRLKNIKEFCKENNYELVVVDTNLNELIHMSHEKTHSFRTLGCVYALEKLFGKYYFASGFHFKEMSIDINSSAGRYDILNVHCLSNENIDFYSSGMETTRVKKINFISNFKETYNWLNVCIRAEYNCCECEKCIRTMVELDSIGKLSNYEKVFDLDKFYKNRFKYFVHILKYSKDKTKKESEFYNGIIAQYKEHKVKIPISAYALSYIPTYKSIKEFIKKILPKKILYKIQKRKGTYRNDGWMD